MTALKAVTEVDQIPICEGDGSKDSKALAIKRDDSGRWVPEFVGLEDREKLLSLLSDSSDTPAASLPDVNGFINDKLLDDWKSICREEIPRKKRRAFQVFVVSKTPMAPKGLFGMCNEQSILNRVPLPIAVSPAVAKYLKTKFGDAAGCTIKIEDNGTVSVALVTEPLLIRGAIDSIKRDVKEGKLPKDVDGQTIARLIGYKKDGKEVQGILQGLIASNPLEVSKAAQKEMSEKNDRIFSLQAILGPLGSLIGIGSLLYVRKQIGMFADMLQVNKQVMALQLKTMQQMDEKAKITDLAEDLVDKVRRDIAENLVEDVQKKVKLVEAMRKRSMPPKVEISWNPYKIVKSWWALRKWQKAAKKLASREEIEAEKYLNSEAKKTSRDAEALELLRRIAEHKNPNTLVNRNLGVDRAVAERAAFLIATSDARVPEKLREAGIWWETKTKFDVIGRRGEALALTGTLARGAYQNAFTRGDTGVGKFEVARAVALLIARDDPRLPPELRGTKLWHVDNTSMIAGTKYRGTFADKQVVLEAELKRGNIIFVEELITQMRAGETSQGDAESYSAWLLRILDDKESRFLFDGKPDDYEALIALKRDFRRRVQPHDVTHLQPLEIRQSLEEQMRVAVEAEKNCSIQSDAVEAAVRLGIAYREVREAPPFDLAKSAMLNAVMLARQEAPNEETKVTVTAEHVARALEFQTAGAVDRSAGQGMFDGADRPHTEHPFVERAHGGNGNGGNPIEQLELEFRSNPQCEGIFSTGEKGREEMRRAAEIVVNAFETLTPSQQMAARFHARMSREPVLAGYPLRFIVMAMQSTAQAEQGTLFTSGDAGAEGGGPADAERGEPAEPAATGRHRGGHGGKGGASGAPSGAGGAAGGGAPPAGSGPAQAKSAIPTEEQLMDALREHPSLRAQFRGLGEIQLKAEAQRILAPLRGLSEMQLREVMASMPLEQRVAGLPLSWVRSAAQEDRPGVRGVEARRRGRGRMSAREERALETEMGMRIEGAADVMPRAARAVMH